MKHDSRHFGGVWPALFTPVDEEGRLNERELGRLIELVIAAGLDGIYLLGSTGQGFLHGEAEREWIAEAALGMVAERVPVIVHVGALSTDESVRLARHAERFGADGISSVGPIYYPASPEMAVAHYRAIAAATALPFFPYQINSAPMDAGMIRQLQAIPNLKGLKLTTLNLLDISSINIRSERGWTLFSGADELLCHAAVCGVAGAIGSTYNLFGPVCRHVRRAFLAGDTQLGIDFMFTFQRLILDILPCIWTFFRRGMLLRHGIDIGRAKAPLLSPELPWTDNELMDRILEVEAFSGGGVKK